MRVLMGNSSSSHSHTHTHTRTHAQNHHTFVWSAGDFSRFSFSIRKNMKKTKNGLECHCNDNPSGI